MVCVLDSEDVVHRIERLPAKILGLEAPDEALAPQQGSHAGQVKINLPQQELDACQRQGADDPPPRAVPLG